MYMRTRHDYDDKFAKAGGSQSSVVKVVSQVGLLRGQFVDWLTAVQLVGWLVGWLAWQAGFFTSFTCSASLTAYFAIFVLVCFALLALKGLLPFLSYIFQSLYLLAHEHGGWLVRFHFLDLFPVEIQFFTHHVFAAEIRIY